MRYLLCSLVLLCFFCRNAPSDNQLTVSVEKWVLRSAPGVKAAETAVLHQGEKVTDLGVVSNFESEIAFGGGAQRAPWLKVQTQDGHTGWVFAGAVQPIGERDEWLFQKRLDCYFGHAFASYLNTWEKNLDAVETDTQCAEVYRTAVDLRDSMIILLKRRADPDGRPDYRWLTDVLPGFVYQQVATGGPPNLFVDYSYWLQKAIATKGAADESFLETCILAFPRDSIESLFPVWKFQLSDMESASQLGTGTHLKMLRQIDKTLAQSRLFEPELNWLKDDILEDIQDKDSRFWQSKELILKEMDEIIASPPTCLTEKESSALRPRRVMLETPEKNGVQVNLRSGE